MALEPSSKALFSQYLGSRKYTVRHHDVDGTVYFETRQDCEPIVEWIKQVKDAPAPKDRDFEYLGEIPMATLGEWMRDGSIDDEKHVRKWLNAHPMFKVYHGTI